MEKENGETTFVNLQENGQATFVLPAGYDPNQIQIIKPEDKDTSIISPVKVAPETVLDHLESDSLESSARIKFIRKVYILVTIMLIITMGFCFLSYFVKNFFSFQVNNFWCFYTFLGISMAITLVMMYCSEAASSMSQGFKYVLLLIFTLCYSYMISFCTSLYAQEYGAPLVLEAMVLTSGMCGALTLYAFIVKTDIRTIVAILIVAVFCFIVFGISFAFTLSGTLHTLYATFGVIIGGIILIIDTNWIADGDRGCSLDDPVLGALIIYIDIIRIFLYILRMMGKRGN